MNLFEISFALIERSLFMTADNLTFSLEIDFIPDIQEGRMDLKAKMKEVAAKYAGTYVLDPKARPIISGLSKEDVENALKDLGLQAFGTWPSCILTCTINTPLPLRAVGMSDGWDIYTGKKTFFAFAQFPADALGLMVKASTYYLEHENYQSLEEFIDSIGYETFRDTVLGNAVADGNGSADSFYGNGGWDSPEVPPLAPGDFVRPENNIMQIIEVYPEMGPFLMEYGMSCVGCFVSYDENLWQAAQGHGMDVFEIIGEMNEFIADKYKKPLLTEDTPMETILTMYPQLLTVFQSQNIPMPSDMKTSIGIMCRDAGADVKTLIAKCDERLRSGDEM